MLREHLQIWIALNVCQSVVCVEEPESFLLRVDRSAVQDLQERESCFDASFKRGYESVTELLLSCRIRDVSYVR